MTTSPNKLSSSHSTPSQTHTIPSAQGTPGLSTLATIEHASPTKALFHTRLNNDITSLTAWLEALHAPDAVPRKFLAWRDQVQQQSLSQLHVGIVGQHSGPFSTASGDDGSKILEALKALKQANLLADHLRALVHEARVEELAALEGRMASVVRQREEGAVGMGCVDGVYAGLEPAAKVALEGLVDAAVLLRVPLGGTSLEDNGRGDGMEEEEEEEEVPVESDLMGVFSRQMLHRAQRRLVLDDQVERLRVLNHGIHPPVEENAATGDLKGLKRLSKQVGAETFTVEDTSNIKKHNQNEQLHAETANFTRDAKQINLKVLEYQERISGLQRKLSKLRAETVSIEDVLNARKQVERRTASVEELEQRIRIFHGLPPDLTASRAEIKRAALELEESKRKREDLFGRISTVER